MPPESQTLESLAQEIAILGDLRVKSSSRIKTHTKLFETAATSSGVSISGSDRTTFENSQYYRNGGNTVFENTSAATSTSNSIPRYETQVVDASTGTSAWQFSSEVKNLEVRWETSLRSDIAPVIGSTAETQLSLYDLSGMDQQRRDVAFENAVSKDTDIYIAILGPNESDKRQFIRNCLGEDVPFVPILGTGKNEHYSPFFL